MRARLRDDAGFTLAELLMAMGLMLVIVSATLTVFEGAQRTSNRSQLQNDAQDTARNAVSRVARDLRNQATPTSQIPVAILKATGTDVVFIAVGNKRPSGSQNARNLERVRYCLNTSTRTLWWQKRTWTTPNPPGDVPDSSSCPASSTWDFAQPIADRISNGPSRPVWSFGPAGYATTDQIRTVDTSLFVDADPASAPPETSLSTSVTLRNQNRAPVASFELKAIGDGHVLLVGTGSSDPEGQSLTYTWKDAGVPIATCSSSTCDFKPAATGTRTFGLTVTDPSGLSADAQDQTITVT